MSTLLVSRDRIQAVNPRPGSREQMTKTTQLTALVDTPWPATTIIGNNLVRKLPIQ